VTHQALTIEFQETYMQPRAFLTNLILLRLKLVITTLISVNRVFNALEQPQPSLLTTNIKEVTTQDQTWVTVILAPEFNLASPGGNSNSPAMGLISTTTIK
jgi:hypothetical protein